MRALLICFVDGFSGVVSFESPEDMDTMISSHVGGRSWLMIFEDCDVEARMMKGENRTGFW